MSESDEKIVRFEHRSWQDGFTVVPNVVLLNSRLTVGARLMWATLAYYARQSNEAWPGQERMAASMDVSERTVRTYLRELERVGLLRTRQRGSISNLYTLLTPSEKYMADFDAQRPVTGRVVPTEAQVQDQPGSQLPGTTGSELPGTTGSQLPTKKTQGEEDTEEEGTALAASGDATGGQLFAAPPAEAKPDMAQIHLDRDVSLVWAIYLQHFEDRLRVKEPTAPRRRTIVKALKAAGWTDSTEDAAASARTAAVELCQRAIVGLKSYRADHPDGSQDVNISVIFETGPHSKSNLTDQITWWADQGKSSVPGRDGAIRIPLDLAGVPSVTKGTIQNRRREVGQMFDHPDSPSAQERGKLAVTWLREHIGHEPKIEDGEFRGWQLVVDYTPPSREDA